MSCCEILTKVFLIFINVIAIVLGLVLIVIGSLWVSLPTSIPGSDSIYPILTLVAGCVICIIAFCGCCGSIIKSVKLLVGYLLLTLVVIGGCIYLCVDFSQVNKAVEYMVTELLNETFIDPDPSSKEQFNVIEFLFKCCGTTGAGSYEEIGEQISYTCCGNIINNIDEIINNSINDTNTDVDICPIEETYGGCIDIVIADLQAFLSLNTIILVVIILFQAMVVLLTFYLIHYIRAQNKKLKAMQRIPGYPSAMGQPAAIEIPRGQPRRQKMPVQSPYYYGSD